MDTLFHIWLVVFVISVPACIYMLVRNNWVYRNRVSRIGTQEYEHLIPYNDMMFRFWVWDIEKLKKP